MNKLKNDTSVIESLTQREGVVLLNQAQLEIEE